MSFSLNVALYERYMELKKQINKYNSEVKEKASDKKKQTEEYENVLKELDKKKEENNNLKKEKEQKENEINDKQNEIKDSIEELKLKNELKELKVQNELDIFKIQMSKDIETLTWKNDGEIAQAASQAKFAEEAKRKKNEIEIIKLKYECLKEKIYNDKEYDELIELARQRKDEIINDELENFKEQKKDLEDFRKKSEKRLKNIQEKNNCDIQKKFLEIQNYKLSEYNKFLMEKKKMFEDFKTKLTNNKAKNENLKNIEIQKAKIYYDQQKNNLIFREQAIQQQKMNINAFIKQLEINEDDYSKYLLNLLK